MKAFRKSGTLAMVASAWGHDFLELIIGGGQTPPAFRLDNGTAIVDIRGPLVHHDGQGWDSYDGIKRRLAEAFACAEANRVLMCINSPGGDVDGCFDSAREIRAMAVAAKKPLCAFADGMAASAAYALACAADEIVVPETGFVGSIGVIEALCDQTAADAAQGLRFVMLTSGTRKADGNPHVPITKEAVDSLQATTDALGELFFDLVADLRGIPQEKLRGFQAALFFGDKAVALGLANRRATLAEVLASKVSTSNTKAVKAKGNTPMPKYLDKEALAKMLGSALMGDDEEEKAIAKKMLKALESKPDSDGDGDGGKKEDADAKALAAKAEEDKKEAAALAASQAALAAGQAPDVVALARELHAMRVERAAEKAEAKASAERSALLATRPDFDAKMVAMMGNWSVDQVRQAVETFPKIVQPAAAAAAATAMGTRGAGQADVPVDQYTKDLIDARMGIPTATTGVQNVGRHLTFGTMTPAQAAARVAELTKGLAS